MCPVPTSADSRPVEGVVAVDRPRAALVKDLDGLPGGTVADDREGG
jgi:hypothetical protein